MFCPKCHTDLPNDARFCIECGTEIGAAATGATIQLPQAKAALACPTCGAPNPDNARFCVICGNGMDGRQIQRLPDPAPLSAPPRPTRPPAPGQHYHPRAHGGHRHRHRHRHGGGPLEVLFPFIFLAGLFSMIFSHRFSLPGLFMLLGLLVVSSTVLRGQIREGLTGGIWMFGLAICFAIPQLWGPAMVVMIGLSILLNSLRRP